MFFVNRKINKCSQNMNFMAKKQAVSGKDFFPRRLNNPLHLSYFRSVWNRFFRLGQHRHDTAGIADIKEHPLRYLTLSLIHI